MPLQNIFLEDVIQYDEELGPTITVHCNWYVTATVVSIYYLFSCRKEYLLNVAAESD